MFRKNVEKGKNIRGKVNFAFLNVSAIKEWNETPFWAFGGLFLEGPFWPCVYGAPEFGGSESALRKAKIYKRTAMEKRSRSVSVPCRSPPGITILEKPLFAKNVWFSHFRGFRH